MKVRFLTDHVSSSGVKRRQGDVRDYPDGMAAILIRRCKAEQVVNKPVQRKALPKDES